MQSVLGSLFRFATPVLILGAAAHAQITATAIRGQVRDQSGASIPGATIRLVDGATNVERNSVSNSDGSFLFPTLQAGSYRLTTSAAGFQNSVINSIVVDSGRTTDVNVELQLGATAQSVEISASALQLETTTNEIGATIQNSSIKHLPYASRSTLNFALLLPGAQSANNDRNSTFNGLPNASLNLIVDGMNNNSQRFKSGGTSFFEFAPTRVDAIEQVSIATAGQGADGAGQGAMSIRFTTRRGSSDYHFKILEQFENEKLNANPYFNTLRGIPRPKTRQNNVVGTFSGPLVPFLPSLKNKLFFMAYFEAQPQPGSTSTNTTMLTAASLRGDYTFTGTNGQPVTVNLLRAVGGSVDPTVQSMLNEINASRTNGDVIRFEPSQTTPYIENMVWLRSTNTDQVYPTARVDYNITPSLAWHGTWNLRHSVFGGRSNYPGSPYTYRDTSKVTTYVASNSVDWTPRPNLINNFVFGVQSNLEYFYMGADIRQWASQGHRRINLPILDEAIHDQVPFDRNNPVYQFTNNTNWVRGKHTLTMGGSYLRTSFYEISQGNAGVLNYNIAISTSDPIGASIRNALGPTLNTANNTDLTNAQNLYALLTGRISSIAGSLNVDEYTKKYERFAPLTQRFAFRTLGLYLQDSYRVKPSLTLNYGLRWQFDGPIHSTNGINSLPGPGSFYGPSFAPFQPGVLSGNLNPTFIQQDRAYSRDFNNPAPNFGLAWNPRPTHGLLAKLLGENRTVISASYGVTFYNEGLNAISNVQSGNRGTVQNISANPDSQYVPGSLSLSSPLPPFSVSPDLFTFPLPMANYVLNGGTNVNYVRPDLRSPYVQNWTVQIQRELARGMILEVRYIGNKSTNVWHNQNYNETNIVENGFLPQFLQAQRNLQVNQANGRGATFQNLGLAGQAPVPIFETAFGANGSNPSLATNQGFGNAAFVQNLQQGAAGAMANTIANTNTPTYYCRLVGGNFAPCRAQGFTGSTAYPINFFRPNPFAANTSMQVSDVNTNYHGLQAEFRKALSHGLHVQAGYTWSHTLGGISNLDNQTATDQWQTVRDGRLDYGPTPFDRRHNFTAAWTWDFPFGKGRRWLSGSNPVVNRIAGGWTLSGVQRISTGSPNQLTSGRNSFNQFADSGVVFGSGMTAGDLLKRLDTVKSEYVASCQCFRSNVADISAANGAADPRYYAPGATPGVIGGTIYIYGKPQYRLDLGIIKETRITERLMLGFQAHAYNFLNHPFLSRGSTTVTGTGFGQITGVDGTSRRTMQLRAYVEW